MKNFLKMRHLLANKPKVTREDRDKLVEVENQLQQMRDEGGNSREVTAEIDSKYAYNTGLRSDICQVRSGVDLLIYKVVYCHYVYEMIVN